MTLDPRLFGGELKKRGYGFFSGVPCSYLSGLINHAINDCRYVAAANEGDAVAICAGASLGGEKACVLMQNSGLTNAASPLTSLNHTFKIPVLGFVSLRGEPGTPDEPQHELTGRITGKLLDLMEIRWEYLSGDMREAVGQLEAADSEYIRRSESFFFVVRKGAFGEETLKRRDARVTENRTVSARSRRDELPSRLDAVEAIARSAGTRAAGGSAAVIATTGMTGRQLHDAGDAPGNFYMVGSMGCAPSLGLGAALCAPRRAVIVVDGDGAALMRLGAMATIGHMSPENLLHVLLDNNSYDSTGGQATVSHNVDFVAAAAAAGYPLALYAHGAGELEKMTGDWKARRGLTFIYLRISRETGKKPGRPGVTPPEVASRFGEFLRSS